MMNIERMRELADAVEKLEFVEEDRCLPIGRGFEGRYMPAATPPDSIPGQFTMASYWAETECGTAVCLAGLACCLWKDEAGGEDDPSTLAMATGLLGLDAEQARAVFNPANLIMDPFLGGEDYHFVDIGALTPEMAAFMLREAAAEEERLRDDQDGESIDRLGICIHWETAVENFADPEKWHPDCVFDEDGDMVPRAMDDPYWDED